MAGITTGQIVDWCFKCQNVLHSANLSNCSFLGIEYTSESDFTGYARTNEDNSCRVSLGRDRTRSMARYAGNVYGGTQDDFDVWKIQESAVWLLDRLRNESDSPDDDIDTSTAWADGEDPFFMLAFTKLEVSLDPPLVSIVEAEECAPTLCETNEVPDTSATGLAVKSWLQSLEQIITISRGTSTTLGSHMFHSGDFRAVVGQSAAGSNDLGRQEAEPEDKTIFLWSWVALRVILLGMAITLLMLLVRRTGRRNTGL